MANLISPADRATYKAAIDDMHDTFGRPITVWRASAQQITQMDEDYDAFAGVGETKAVYTPESQEFKARIKYIDRQEKEFGIAAANTNINIAQEFQMVRIKVDALANDYIRDCEKVTIDGQDFRVLTVPRPHGLFEPDYYTIYLTTLP